MAKGKSSQYYATHPEARAKKQAYQREYNKKDSQVKKRVELTKINRDRGTYGNNDGKDYDHAAKKMVSASVNRGRNSKNSSKYTSGDKKARG